MKPQLSESKFETNITALRHDFTIRMSPHIAKLLSSQTYSDKTLAAIREPLSNAYDSHVRAGTLDIPIDLHLPTQLEPHFSLRDYGTGLSHDDVIRFFMSYGDSDKWDHANEIGGLGIGAKSFYSYSDIATVTSWYQGQKRLYALSKSEEGLPQGMLVHTEETDEPNGIELHYSVQPRDINTFKEKTQEVLTYLELSVNSNVGLSFKRPSEFFSAIIDGHRMVMLSSNGEHKAIMGGIAYDVPSEVWYYHMNKKYNAEVEFGFLMHLPIGSVEISASRETLSPTEADKDFMADLLHKFQQQIRAEDWTERLENAATWMDAVRIREHLRGLLGRDLYYDDSGKQIPAADVLKWQNLPTYQTLRFADGSTPVMHVSRTSRRGNKYHAVAFCAGHVFSNSKVQAIYWLPKDKKVGWRNWYVENRHLDYYNQHDIHIHADSLEQARELAALIGFDQTVLDGSGLRIAGATRKAAVPRPTGTVWVYGSYNWYKAKLDDLDPDTLIYTNSFYEAQVARNLSGAGVLRTTPTFFKPYGLTEATANKRYGHLPKTTTEWCQAHPDQVDMDQWAEHALAYQLNDHWNSQPSWVKWDRIKGHEQAFGFPVTLYKKSLTEQPLKLAPLPNVKPLIAKIERWHETRFPKLPKAIQHSLKRSWCSSHDELVALYSEMKK